MICVNLSLKWFRKKYVHAYINIYKESTHNNKANEAKVVTNGKSGKNTHAVFVLLLFILTFLKFELKKSLK